MCLYGQKKKKEDSFEGSFTHRQAAKNTGRDRGVATERERGRGGWERG